MSSSTSSNPKPIKPLDITKLQDLVKDTLTQELDLDFEIEKLQNLGVNDTVNFSVHLTSLFTAQALARTLTAPIERVRLIMQTQAVSNAPFRSYIQGLYHATFRLPSNQGYLALWRGNGTNIFRALPACCVVFSSIDQHKEMLCGAGMAEKKTSIGKRVSFAGFFGLCATLVSYPLDVLRTRLSVDMTKTGDVKPTSHGSMSTLMKSIVKTEGWRALYRGVSLSLISSVPYATISFTAYDNLKGRYERADRAKEGGAIDTDTFMDHLLGKSRKNSIMAGTWAFTFASALVYPLDTLRRRLIVDGSEGHQRRLYIPIAEESGSGGNGGSGGSGGSGKCNIGSKGGGIGSGSLGGGTATGTSLREGVHQKNFSTSNKIILPRGLSGTVNTNFESMSETLSARGPPPVQAALRIWYEEGIIGFYRGFFANIVRSIPRAAIMFLTFDVVKSTLMPQETSSLRRTITRLRNEGGE